LLLWIGIQKMESAIERIDATYTYHAPTYSIAIVSMSSLSVVFSEIGEPQPSMTTTIGSFTKDPFEYEGSEWDLYEFVDGKPMGSLDPMGEWAIPVVTCGGCLSCLGPGAIACGMYSNSFEEFADCYRYYLSILPTWHKWGCAGACAGCTAYVAKPIILALIPLVPVGIRTFVNTCKNLRCTVRWHTAHHPFPGLGKKCHIKLQCWVNFVEAPPKKISIPIHDNLCPPRDYDLWKLVNEPLYQ